jgi:hypothetical protein
MLSQLWPRRARSAAPRRSRHTRGLATAVLTCAAFALPASAEAVVFALGAGDVCPPTSDPCVVFDVVNVADGAVLDFGTRTLEIRPSGKIAAGLGPATIRCGSFSATNSEGASIEAHDPGAVPDGGSLRIEARGRCGGEGAACLRDADCSAETCETTSGHVELSGAVRVDGPAGGAFAIVAAGDVKIGASIGASSSDVDSDGGQVSLVSSKGSVEVNAAIAAVSGRSGQGGEIEIAAPLDVSGGEFDGGTVTLDAGNDVLVGASIRASATRLDGAGGDVSIDAARNLHLGGTALVETNGGRAADFGGDGGAQRYTAGGDVTVDAAVLLSAQGARPDAGGGSIELEAGGALEFSGSLIPGASAALGAGGSATLSACDVTLANGAVIENVGDGGENEIRGRGLVTLETGSKLHADAATGTNRVVFGDADLQPVVDGEVVPEEVRVFQGELGPCAAPPTTVLPTTTTLVTTTVTVTTTSTTVTTVTTTTTEPPPPGCGNGVVEGTEECDAGPKRWSAGQSCRFDCTLVACGDPDDSGQIKASDALFILRCAIGAVSCSACICDVDGTGGDPKAGDALRVLRTATGVPLEFSCPPCD